MMHPASAPMDQKNVIVFVCEHGAAKSIIAATYFNQLAKQRGLNWSGIARGTDPDYKLSEPTIQGLSGDGLTPRESTPQKLSSADIESAQGMVSFCELPEELQAKTRIEQWVGIPPVSENYENARDAIVQRVRNLLDRLMM